MTDDDQDFDDLPPEPIDNATLTRKEHDLYLKAVNNSVRKRILELVTIEDRDVDDLTALLQEDGLVAPDGAIAFHLDLLAKAECVNVIEDEDSGRKVVKITEKGQVVDHFY